MFPKAKNTPNKIDLQMTPMIDVVFQLLIFFILTLQLPKTEGMIETMLPTAPGPEVNGPELASPFSDIILTLTRQPNGAVARTLNAMPVRSDRQLESHLAKMKDVYSDGRIVIACDGAVPYGHLVRTMSVVQRTGMTMAFSE